MSDEFNRIRELFDASIELPQKRRVEFLRESCNGSEELQREVSLLVENEALCDSEGFLDWNAKGRNGTSPTQVGRYKLIERIGSGATGTVYRACNVEDIERIVAVKLMKGSADSDALHRFEVERRALADLKHPGIARLIDWGTTGDGAPFLVMDFVDGERLDYALEQRVISVRQRVEWFLSICRIVEAAHERGIAHRDLKPGNILVDPDNRLVITDFGLAKFTDERRPEFHSLTATGSTLGTPGYMAPEQIDSKRSAIGLSVDIYGLGAVLYFLLTERPPYRTNSVAEAIVAIRDAEPISPRQLVDGLDKDLETICLKCLEKAPSSRYSNVQSLVSDVESYLADLPIKARPVSIFERIVRWSSRNPALATTFTLLLVLGTAAFITITSLWQVSEARSDQLEERHTRLVRAVDELFTDTSKWVTPLAVSDEVRRGLLSKAQKHHEQLQTLSPKNKEGRVALAEATFRLAKLSMDMSDPVGSKAYGTEALELFTQLRTDYPRDLRFQFDIFHCYHLMRDRANALESITALLETDGLHDSPDYAYYQDAYVAAFRSYARDSSDARERERYESAALSVAKELALAFPNDPFFNRHHFGLLIDRAERTNEFEQLYLEAIRALTAARVATASDEGCVQYRGDYWLASSRALFAAAVLGKRNEATQLADEMLAYYARVRSIRPQCREAWWERCNTILDKIEYGLWSGRDERLLLDASFQREVEAALLFWPDDKALTRYLVAFLSEYAFPKNRDLERARALLVSLQDEAPSAYLGLAFLRLGDYKSAEEHLAPNAKNPGGLYIALLHAKRGEFEKADRHLRDVAHYRELYVYQRVSDEVESLRDASSQFSTPLTLETQ